MNVKLFYLLSFSFLVNFTLLAQNQQQDGITMEQTIEFLNDKLGNDLKIELIKRKQIVITFFKKGTVYKIDKIYLETLDTNNIVYSQEENMLILHCKDEKFLEGSLKKFRDGCVEREIPEKDMVGAYARSNINVGSDKKKIESIKKAFIHLAKLVQEEGYHSNAPFE